MKLGFIGCGNMATAMIKGIVGNGIVAKEDIMGADLSQASIDKIAGEMGIAVTTDNKEVAGSVDVLVLSVVLWRNA